MKPLLAAVFSWLFTVLACQGKSQLPEPPQQHQAWHPDSPIAANIHSAANTMFEQGFPDPRGCEYREIEVECSMVFATNVWPVKTRGWVLPAKSNETNRFAICWNGLIYPVVTLGAPADLHTEANDVGTAGWPTWGTLEPQAVIFKDATYTRGLLLLRAGEIAAGSEELHAFEQMSGRDRGQRPGGFDPYAQWAGSWAWGLFGRAICAHVRGDQELALATARQLAALQPKLEAECAKRGIARPRNLDPEQAQKPCFDFLEQLPQLLADLERREKERPFVSARQIGLDQFTNPAERIAALIRDLELIPPLPLESSGGTNLTLDATVAALMQEGDAAIDPLLDCLEKDKRLTRVANYVSHEVFPGHSVVPVSTVAGTAIQAILHAGFGGNVSEIRAYWKTYRNVKLADRWYAILNDNTARGRWLEAAGNMIELSHPITFPQVPGSKWTATLSKPAQMPGEILRSKSNPSVSELMARRALEVQTDASDPYDLSAACQVGLHLAAWDAPSAGAAVKTLSQRCRSAMADPRQNLGSFLTKLAIARAWAGDPGAFDDYAGWLPTLAPEQLGFWEPLQPLKEYPTNSVLRSMAEKMFDNLNSKWSGLSWSHWKDNLASGEFARVPAIRRYLARELDRKEICGSVLWEGGLQYTISNGMGSMNYELPEGKQPANGTKAQLRSCDWLAVLLSAYGGTPPPRYNPFPPEAQRDLALETMKDYLRK